MTLTHLVSVCTFLGGVALFAAVHEFIRDLFAAKIEWKLKELAGGTSPSVPKLLVADARAAMGQVGTRFRHVGDSAVAAAALCEQAGAPFGIRGLAVLTVSLTLVAIVASAFFHLYAPAIPLIAVAAFVAPTVILLVLRSRRRIQFARQLPAALELISRALRAGHGLVPAMHCVATEMLPPLSKEFAIACQAQSLGSPVEKTLQNMLLRMPNEDLRFFATTVRMQQRTGGNLAEVLDKISRIVRERFRIYGQIRALTGEGRLSGIFLMALPIVSLIAIQILNPGYIEPLYTEPLGKKMIIGAAALQLVGALVIRRIVLVKV